MPLVFISDKFSQAGQGILRQARQKNFAWK